MRIYEWYEDSDSHNATYNLHCVQHTHYITANWIRVFATTLCPIRVFSFYIISPILHKCDSMHEKHFGEIGEARKRERERQSTECSDKGMNRKAQHSKWYCPADRIDWFNDDDELICHTHTRVDTKPIKFGNLLDMFMNSWMITYSHITRYFKIPYQLKYENVDCLHLMLKAY